MLLAFDLIANWCWKEQRSLLPMNQLYILFLIFYINFFKREFWIFSNEHFDRLHSTKFSIATREFYIWEALCQVKHPCRPFSLTLTLILLSIQLSATEFFFHQFFICSEQFLFCLFFFCYLQCLLDISASLFQPSPYKLFSLEGWGQVAGQMNCKC